MGLQAVLKYSPTGRYLAAGFEDGAVILFDPDTGAQIGDTIVIHDWSVHDIVFSDDEKYMLTAAGLNAYFWDISPHPSQLSVPWQPRLETHPEEGASVTFSPDGQIAASLSDGNTIQVWDMLTGKASSQPITAESLAAKYFYPIRDGYFLVDGEQLRVWNAFNNEFIGLPVAGDPGYTWALSNDGHTLFMGTRTGFQAYDLRTGRRMVSIMQINNNEQLLGFEPSGQTVASVSMAGKIMKDLFYQDVLTGAIIDQKELIPIKSGLSNISELSGISVLPPNNRLSIWFHALFDPKNMLAGVGTCQRLSLITNICLVGRLELWDTTLFYPSACWMNAVYL